MAQHDYDIANGSGAAVRADINALAAAIASQNSGSAAPSPTFANMLWMDTSTGLLKQRNPANNAWWGLAASLLGTVAQSSGKATGGLLEIGSNANGSYIKFANGLMLCWTSISITPTTANTPKSATWTFPVAFAAAPTNVQCTANTNVPGTGVTGVAATTITASNAAIYLTRTDTTATSIFAFAIGTWF